MFETVPVDFRLLGCPTTKLCFRMNAMQLNCCLRVNVGDLVRCFAVPVHRQQTVRGCGVCFHKVMTRRALFGDRVSCSRYDDLLTLGKQGLCLRSGSKYKLILMVP